MKLVWTVVFLILVFVILNYFFTVKEIVMGSLLFLSFTFVLGLLWGLHELTQSS